jgi:hypothetical protein
LTFTFSIYVGDGTGFRPGQIRILRTQAENNNIPPRNSVAMGAGYLPADVA